MSVDCLAPIRHPIVQYPQATSVHPTTLRGISSTCQPNSRNPFSSNCARGDGKQKSWFTLRRVCTATVLAS